ncbi:hypothetical protein DPQ98_33445 [Burkholderia pseudomallei]|nr:hypothetical protein DPQ98_33445 [Burkholderia pseudomallei]
MCVGRRASGVGRRASGVGRRASGVGRRAASIALRRNTSRKKNGPPTRSVFYHASPAAIARPRRRTHTGTAVRHATPRHL